MQKNKNTGFSMVEIIISVAIFSILIIPIISGIISSMKNTTNAKTLQNRNEFAENVMEYVKTDSLENILEGTYLNSVGSYTDSSSKAATVQATFYTKNGDNDFDTSLNEIRDLLQKRGDLFNCLETSYNNGQAKTKLVSGVEVENDKYQFYPYEEYLLSGKVRLGSQHDNYVYRVQISNEAYAEAEKLSYDASTGKLGYMNPNNTSFGVVEDLDYKKLALINGTIANYDASVSNAFLSRKIEALKNTNKDWFDIYTNQTSNPDLFPGDTVTRRIVIKVSGSFTKGYNVKCKLIYHDNCESRPDVKTYLKDHNMDNIQYTPFEYIYPVDSSTGVAELPNIYLMYNVCVYNSAYSPHDYIVVDTSELEDNPDDNRPVNIFIVETAEKFTNELVNSNPEITSDDNVLVKMKDKVMYNNDVKSGVSTRDNVGIHILTTRKSADTDTLKNVHIYHNFDVTHSISGVNHKNSNVYYVEGVSGTLTSEILSMHPLKDDGTEDTADVYCGVNGDKKIKTSRNTFVTGASVQALNQANEEKRGLYQVKIWMQEGDDPSAIDINNTQPILTATKGDAES